MLRHLLNELAKRTQHFLRFQGNMCMFMCPRPLARSSGPSTHALVQQCCVNVAKRFHHHTASKMLHEKSDRFQIWSNIIQRVATYRNRVADFHPCLAVSWPSLCNMLCPTMLQDVALKCCKRLARVFRPVGQLTFLMQKGIESRMVIAL